MSNAQGARVGIVLVSPEGVRLEHLLRLSFRASNNEVEYEALISRLKAVKKLDVQLVEIISDSCLVVSQVGGSFEVKDPWLAEYLKMIGTLLASFQKAKVSQISRGKNSCADSLATLASFVDNWVPWIIIVEVL